MSTRLQIYVSYLQSDHWDSLRIKSFQAAEFRCEVCADNRKISGHHLVYREPLTLCTVNDIMCMCERCHNAFHRWLDVIGRKAVDYDRAATKSITLRLRSGGNPPPDFRKPHPVQVRKNLPVPPISGSAKLWELAKSKLTPDEITIFTKHFSSPATLGKGKWNRAIKLLQRRIGKPLVFLKDCPRGAKARELLSICSA